MASISLKSVTPPLWIKTWLKTFLNQVSFKLTDQYCSGAPAAQRAAKQSPINIPYTKIKGDPWIDFLMVIMASGIAWGRVRMVTTVSCNMAAMLLQYREMHPRFVVEVCHLFFGVFSKKRKQTIAEVELTFCTEAKKNWTESKNYQARKRALGQPWGSRQNSTEQCHEL